MIHLEYGYDWVQLYVEQYRTVQTILYPHLAPMKSITTIDIKGGCLNKHLGGLQLTLS